MISGRMNRLNIVFLIIIFHACSSDSNTDNNILLQSPGNEATRTECDDVIPTPYGLWSEFLSTEEILSTIPTLHKKNIALYQAISSEKIGDSDYARLFNEVSCSGVELRAWLTLPKEQGYFPNEKNVEQFSLKALELAEWIRESGWNINWIIVDMEPDLQMMTALFDSLASGNLIDAVKIFKGNHDPESFKASVFAYQKMVDDLHSLGFKVMVVTFPLVLDDMSDQDSSIQDLLNIPISGINWDSVSFMAYTSLFEQILGQDISEYLVYTYAEDAVKYFGNKAAIDIGTISNDSIIEIKGITDIEELKKHVGAAKRTGISEIHAYSLDGILSLENPVPFFDMFDAQALDKVKKQLPVVILRNGLELLDKLID